MVEEIFFVLGLGFLLGLKHAFEPDHLAAVSTIVSRKNGLKKSAKFGAIWGLGHLASLFFVAIAILFLKISISPQVTASLELAVGLMLVFLGIGVLHKAIVEKPHFHQHAHEKIVHAHFHSHNNSELHEHFHRPFFIGAVHGLAGSAALMLLVLASIKSALLGFFYILAFGLGSILGMLLASALISLPFIATARFDKVQFGAKIIAGIASVAFGLIIISKIAIWGFF